MVHEMASTWHLHRELPQAISHHKEGISQEWKDKILARRARLENGDGSQRLAGGNSPLPSRPRTSVSIHGSGVVDFGRVFTSQSKDSVYTSQSKDSVWSDNAWDAHKAHRRKWHRWSRDRVEPESWDDFREVKAKLPPVALRRKQNTRSKPQLERFVEAKSAPRPSNGRRGSITSFIGHDTQAPSWSNSHTVARHNHKHLKPVAGLGIESLMIDLLIRSADPDGDFSWHCPDPRSLEQLPKKLAATGRWQTFNDLLCDLKFCFQKLKHFPSSVLLRDFALYEPAISDSDQTMQRFTQYRSFFRQHHMMLSKKPSCLFKLAAACKYECIAEDTQIKITNCYAFVEKWYKHLLLKDEEYREMQLLDYRQNGLDSGSSKKVKNKDLLAVRQLAKLVTVRTKVFSFHECGIGACFTPSQRQVMSELLSFLQQKIQSQRSLLLQEGMQMFTDPNMDYLTKDTHRKVPDRVSQMAGAATEDSVGEDATKFLHLVQIWDETEQEEYVGLEVFVPAHTWEDDVERHNFEQRICRHVAEAARIPAHLVEVDKFTCAAGNSHGGTPGVVIMRVSDYVRTLEVGVSKVVLAPSLGRNFGLGESSISVTLQLRAIHGMRRSNAHHHHDEDDVHVPLGLHQERMKPLSTQQQPYRDSDTEQEIVFNESFQFRAPYDGLELHITCYDNENGNPTSIGEIGVALHDIVSFCATDKDDRHQHTFPLMKHDTRKHKTAMVHLQFHDKVLAGSNGRSARTSAEAILTQAVDPDSKLRQKLVVTGPCYDERGGGWEDLSLYVSSDFGQMQQEREFLDRFVFPALRLVSLERRLKFHWHEHSRFGTRFVSENLAKRVHDLDNCRIRTTDSEAHVTDMHFLLALVGESPGRHLSMREMSTLDKVTSKYGSLEWASQLARSEYGLTAHQMELLHVMNTESGPAEPIIALRNPAFLADKAFVECVPARVRAVFSSKGDDAWGKMTETRRSMARMSGVVQYAPAFKDFRLLYGENLEKVPAQDAASKVVLSGMDELGFKIFQSVWKKIRKRYSTARCVAQTDLFMMERHRQRNAMLALSGAISIFPEQTQRSVIRRLVEVHARTDEGAPGIVFLVGAHGSGKSSLLAYLVHTLLNPQAEKLRTQAQETLNAGAVGYLDSQVQVNALPAFQTNSVLQNTAKMVVKANRIMRWTRRASVEPSLARAASSSSKALPQPSPTSPSPVIAALSDAAATTSPLQSPFPASTMSSPGLPSSIPRVSQEDAGSPSGWDDHSRAPARVVYFFKSSGHTTEDLIFFLASSIAGKTYAGDLRWSTVDSFIRQMPPQPHRDSPVLLVVLDGLNPEETDNVRKLANRPHLPVRFIVSANSGAIDSSFQVSITSDFKEGLKSNKNAVTINVPPLSHMEQLAVYAALKRRFGVTQAPKFAGSITRSEGARCPLFLSVLVCYYRMCTGLRVDPKPLDLLQTEAEELLLTDIIPTLEGELGTHAVCAFFQVVMEFADGCTTREITQMLTRLNVRPEHISSFSDILRPLSDPRIALSAGSVLAFSRAFIRRALERRYNVREEERSVMIELQTIRDSVDVEEGYACEEEDETGGGDDDGLLPRLDSAAQAQLYATGMTGLAI